jgi:proteasome assembly chaperone (PAC2) family protein
MNIQFYTKNVYGKDYMYAVDPEQAKVLTALTKGKTILKSDMEGLEKLGHTFEQVLPPTQ